MKIKKKSGSGVGQIENGAKSEYFKNGSSDFLSSNSKHKHLFICFENVNTTFTTDKIGGSRNLVAKFLLLPVSFSKNRSSNNFLQTPHKKSFLDPFSDVAIVYCRIFMESQTC